MRLRRKYEPSILRLLVTTFICAASLMAQSGMASGVNMDTASLIWNSQNHNHPLSYQNLYELYMSQSTAGTNDLNLDRNMLSESNFNKIKANYEYYNANRRPLANQPNNQKNNFNIFHGSNLNTAGVANFVLDNTKRNEHFNQGNRKAC